MNSKLSRTAAAVVLTTGLALGGAAALEARPIHSDAGPAVSGEARQAPGLLSSLLALLTRVWINSGASIGGDG